MLFHKLQLWVHARNLPMPKVRYRYVVAALASLAPLILAGLTPLNLVTSFWLVITLYLVALALYYRRRRERIKKLAQAAPLSPIAPSAITLSMGVLDDDELQSVLYDARHHGMVTLQMVFNPFWGEKHDIKPEMTAAVRKVIESKGDEFLRVLLKVAVSLAQIIIAIASIAAVFQITGLVLTVAGHRVPFVWLGPVWGTLFTVGLILVQAWWIRYILRLAERCRLIVTHDAAHLVIDQLPWRSSGTTTISRAHFDGFVDSQSVLGSMLGYVDFVIRTREQEERLPAWIRASQPDRLKQVFKYWQHTNRVEAAARLANQPLAPRAEDFSSN